MTTYGVTSSDDKAMTTCRLQCYGCGDLGTQYTASRLTASTMATLPRDSKISKPLSYYVAVSKQAIVNRVRL